MSDEIYLHKATEARQAWFAKWPHHCRQCDGWGFFSWHEEHNEILMEPCDHLPEGSCHRCGFLAVATEKGQMPCLACGWHFNDGAPGL